MNTFVTARILRVAAAIGSTGALATGVLVAAAAPAGASTLSCGDVITSNVTLHRNLDCSSYTSGPGLVIGRPDVTVNLNGHEILGPGDVAGTPGVIAGFSGDKVKGGSIEDYPLGVVVAPAKPRPLTGVVIHDVKIMDSGTNNDAGILGLGLKGATISEVSVSKMATGMVLAGSHHSTLAGNTVAGAGTGIVDESGMANTLTRNNVRGLGTEGGGIILAGTKDDKVKGNSVAGKDAAGIVDLNSSHSLISGNALSHLFYGVLSDAAGKSQISGNHGTADAWGILLSNSSKSAVSGNMFGHGGYGIEADSPFSLTVEHNVTSHNAQVGVLLTTEGSLGASKNSGGAPGAPSALVSFNKSNYNGVGFYSQFPTTGHGNDADHDTILACYNVSCSHAAGMHHGMFMMPAHHNFWVPVLPKTPSFKR